jgi:hypothetical protein
VGRHQHAADEGVDVLVDAEAVDANVAEGTHRAALEAGAESLGGVFQQRHPALAADRRDPVHLAGEAVQMRHQHRAGVGVMLAGRGPA